MFAPGNACFPVCVLRWNDLNFIAARDAVGALQLSALQALPPLPGSPASLHSGVALSSRELPAWPIAEADG